MTQSEVQLIEHSFSKTATCDKQKLVISKLYNQHVCLQQLYYIPSKKLSPYKEILIGKTQHLEL